MGINPKRRKSKDNPYTLNYIEEKKVYFVSFKDCRGINRKVEVTEEVYKAFNKFELNDLKELNEYDRHIEHSQIYESSLYSRAKNKPISLEDEIIRKSTFEDLRNAINYLPTTQRRRIKQFYFQELTTKEIADKEHCTQHSVRVSIRRAIQELNKILKKNSK